MADLTVVLPVHNEAAPLDAFLDELRLVLDALDREILVLAVDDGSTDESWAIIKRRAQDWCGLGGLRLARHFGKEQALAAGIEAARTDAVLVMDADGQHPVGLVPDMIARWGRTGADVIEAVKERRGGESWSRERGSRLFYVLWEWLTGRDLTGATDFKLLGPRAKAAWCEMEERNVFFRGMVAWLGMRVEQVAFEAGDRASGDSRFRPWALLRLSVTAVTSFSSAPLTIIAVIGLGMLTLSLVLGTWTLVDWVFGAKEGFTTVILLQLFIGSLLLISLGIIGEYVARIYDEVKRRPRYLVSERTE